MSQEHFNLLCYIWIAIAVVIHVVLFFIAAPFGRHTSNKWGPQVNNKVAWMVMEFPSLAIVVYFLASGTYSLVTYAWILFVLWIFHYINRTFVYPLRIRPTEKKMPLVIMLNAIFFNLVNAGLNGYYLAELSGLDRYGMNWLTSPITITGFVLFCTGLLINWKSDHMLIQLRKPGDSGYKIPKGFLFDFISSPNLLGEIVEWAGFALMAWNLPALTFAIWTYANLVPRAKNHHDWYHSHFDGYPRNRKALFPFLF